MDLKKISIRIWLRKNTSRISYDFFYGNHFLLFSYGFTTDFLSRLRIDSTDFFGFWVPNTDLKKVIILNVILTYKAIKKKFIKYTCKNVLSQYINIWLHYNKRSTSIDIIIIKSNTTGPPISKSNEFLQLFDLNIILTLI